MLNRSAVDAFCIFKDAWMFDVKQVLHSWKVKFN